MSRWRWVLHDGGKLYDVGLLSDGTLHNPRGYPDDVRAAVLAADERRHARRSQAAKKAAETRRKRQEKRVYDAARQLVEGRAIGPRSHCAVCERRLDDVESIQRGVGSECWQSVLAQITATLAGWLEQ